MHSYSLTLNGRNGYSVGDAAARQQHHPMQQQSRHQQTSVSIDHLPSPEEQGPPEEQQQQATTTGVSEGVIKKSSLKKRRPAEMPKQESKVSVGAAGAQEYLAGGGGGKKEKRGRRRRRKGTATAPDSQCLTTAGDGSSKASSVCGGGGGMGRTARENSSSSLCGGGGGGRDNPLLLRQSALRIGEDSVVDRCTNCGAVREEYAEDEVGHCIIILNTFIAREPALAAPLLPEILLTVSRVARQPQYSWELDSNAYVPGNSRSIARQFMRCVLHGLSANGISSKIFLLEMENNDRRRQSFFGTLVQCLLDFTELSPSALVALFMQEMNERKAVTLGDYETCLPNLATYFKSTQFAECKWEVVFGPAETFFRRLWALTGTPQAGAGGGSAHGGGGKGDAGVGKGSRQSQMEKGGGTGPTAPSVPVTTSSSSSAAIQLPAIEPLFHTMTSVLRMPGVINNRMVLDPLAKLLSYSLQNCTNINFPQLVSLCHYCNRCFIKERDKQLLTRTAVIELVQALKFKTAIPDANFLMLTNLVLLDAGGAIAIGTEYADSFPKLEFETVLGGGSTSGGPGSSPGGGSIAPGSSISTTNTPLYTTAASEVMRAHMADVLEFLSDVHTLSKVKSSVKANAAAAKPGGGGGSGTGAAAGASSGTGAASSGAVGVGLNEDTLGGILKASLSQYLALEIAKGNGKDSR